LRVVLASANPDKAAEIVEILAPLGFEVAPRPPDLADVDETEDSLEGNARLKAMAVARASGEPALADDTGLEVDALDGAPGVRTARYAGEDATYGDNVAKLIAALRDVGDAPRTARFRTVATLCWPDGREVVAEGAVTGRIAGAPRGDRGFGYDPVFIPDEGDGCTFAEMSEAEKHALSHRGRALRALAEKLRRSPAP
jgi:XTP/dITP diphosphohydrolase